jgi:phosphoadenosine phosphosulfate reductase
MSDLSNPDAGEAMLFSDATQSRYSNPDDRTAVRHARKATRSLARISEDLASALHPLDLFHRLNVIRAQIPDRLVFTTSFGLEDQAIGHAIFSQGLAIEVVTLDTGRLFPETHDVWAETERRYGIRVQAFVPARTKVEELLARQGINGFRSSLEARHACCDVRKVMPLGRALADASGWITGLRSEQSADRGQAQMASLDKRRNLVKVNPLLDWRRDQVLDFIRTHDVPYNPLHDRGFLSIGCAPCTRAVLPGEPERAGRWWWEQESQKECGLHITPDGRVVRAKTTQPSNAFSQ